MKPGLALLVAVAAVLAGSPTAATGAPADRATALSQYEGVVRDLSVGPGWTGSSAECRVGTESQASLDATLRTINALRSFAEAPPVALDPERNRRALAAALMMNAAGRLSHSPGTDWPCYSEDGRRAAETSNLARGYASGPEAMVGYVNDDGVASLGHRRWILNPTAQVFGSGSTDSTNALTVIGANDGPAYPKGKPLAWPPAGWVPWEWFFADWSVAIGGEPHASGVSLDGADVTVSLDGAPLGVSGLRRLEAGFGYGTGPVLTWQVAVPASALESDGRLDVSIAGVTVDGAPHPIDYTVNAFATDAPGPAPSPRPLTPSLVVGKGWVRRGRATFPLRFGPELRGRTAHATIATYARRCRSARSGSRRRSCRYSRRVGLKRKRIRIDRGRATLRARLRRAPSLYRVQVRVDAFSLGDGTSYESVIRRRSLRVR